MEKYYKQFNKCRQNEKPFCTDTCPFNMDVLNFLEKLSKGRYNGAYKIFRNAVAFPDIVSYLCSEYCGNVCPRKNVDKSIQINLLEKTCVSKSTKKEPNNYNLPLKKESIGIIGGGISGLACALRLSSKKYNVTIYEKGNRLGGHLWDLMPSEIFIKDIKRQFQFEKYKVKLNTEIKNLEDLSWENFDALYVATGKNGNSFGLLDTGTPCKLIEDTAVFAGGMLTGKDIVQSISQGLEMSKAIEVYIKTKKIEYPTASLESKVVIDNKALYESKAICPSKGQLFSDEEVLLEIDRCHKCQCNACMNNCDICAFQGKWPLEMRDEIMTTVMASDSIAHKTPAIRLINSCTQCGLCDETCIENIELGSMLSLARYKLHEQNKMPGIFHQFWLRDMEFANGDFASIVKAPPRQKSCDYAFFPGCHLGASNPEYVIRPYKWLLEKNPNTGLFVHCCGVPADWAGNEALHKNSLDILKSNWMSLGKPILILACPTCGKHLEKYLPEIETISLYEILDKWDFTINVETKDTFSIFDPCSTLKNSSAKDSVRKLSSKANIDTYPLPKSGNNGCCGFGGHPQISDPKFTDFVTERRANLSEYPYLVYCINCRDIFLDKGKPSMHIIELLFSINKKPLDKSYLPDVTTRRNNRVLLKEMLLKEIWSENMTNKPSQCKYNLILSDEIKGKMNNLKILSEDICSVLDVGEVKGRRTFDPEKSLYKCYSEIGHITCWVEYRKNRDDNYEILNVYIHRMKIELEGVWNGKKINTDM